MPPSSILVTGGAGYIGSHTVLELAAHGHTVVIYDNLSTGHADLCDGHVFVQGDLSDRDLLAQTMTTHNVTHVIHFAALIEAGVSMREPLSFFQNNVAGTLTLLEAMDRAGVRNIVFSSTAAVYGEGAGQPMLSEALPMAPINPYGDSKAMIETVLRAQAAAKGLNAIALRYFNACGADPQCRSGERHDPETHLIPLVIQAALGQRAEIAVFGTDYDTPDGTCVRDYIHVSDLARGHVAALASQPAQPATPEGSFACFNLGTGQGYSVHQVIAAVQAVAPNTIPVRIADRRPGDPPVLVADPGRANSVLGWTARASDLETIIADAWRFATTGLARDS